MEEDKGEHWGQKQAIYCESLPIGWRRVGEDRLTLQGDSNMLPAGSFRWCCGEGFLDNVANRGEQKLKTQKSPEGGTELGANIPLQVSRACTPTTPPPKPNTQT